MIMPLPMYAISVKFKECIQLCNICNGHKNERLIVLLANFEIGYYNCQFEDHWDDHVYIVI